MLNILAIIGAYLIGSVSSAVLVSKAMGLPDPRTAGSRNPGATNVLRLGNKTAAGLTLLGDIVKGVLPVLAARLLTMDEWIVAACGLAAFLGHLFPLFLNFKGGKGVATAIGVYLALAPLVALLLIATWLATVAITRYSSLSALVAALMAPIYTFWITGSSVYTAMAVVMALLVVFRHHANIKRLLSGTESRIGQKS